jgi:exopolysaccharide biosynthesis protein
MAGNIQLVFFAPKKGNGDILVKVLLNGEEARFGKLQAVTGPYYRWADVKDFLNARIAKYVYRPAKGEWTVTEVAPGLVYRSFTGLDPISGSAQQVFVADWDMKVPGYALKFVMSEIPEKKTTSQIYKETGAVVAMNAAYEPPSIVLKVDGETLFNMPNNTIMATGVPNWKSEAALYIGADGKPRIAYEGKGRTREELRSFYAASKEPNIYTSAPMLIDDYNPVGLSFAGFYSEDAMERFNYEDLIRHQGVRHPRTVVATTEDDHLLLIVVDGRRDGISEGMSARELTRFLVDNFNPRDAINMDGGGSSTLCVEGQGDPDTHVVNYPTNNKLYDHAGERTLYSFICLVRE